MKQFLYVFSDGDRDKLLIQGATLLKSNEKDSIFVFANDPKILSFAVQNISFIESDSITL